MRMALHELSMGSRGPVAVGSALGASPVGGTPRSAGGATSRASLSALGRSFPSSNSLAESSVDDYWDAQSAGATATAGDGSVLGSSWGESGTSKLAELRACLVAAQQRQAEQSRHDMRLNDDEDVAALDELSHPTLLNINRGHHDGADGFCASPQPAYTGSHVEQPTPRSAEGSTRSSPASPPCSPAEGSTAKRWSADGSPVALSRSASSSAGSASSMSSEDRVYVARMVAEMCARAATRADLETSWRHRVRLLEARLGLAKEMTRAMLRQHRRAMESVEPWAQTLIQGGLVVGATVAGGAVALLVLRLLTPRSTASSSSSTDTAAALAATGATVDAAPSTSSSTQ